MVIDLSERKWIQLTEEKERSWGSLFIESLSRSMQVEAESVSTVRLQLFPGRQTRQSFFVSTY